MVDQTDRRTRKFSQVPLPPPDARLRMTNRGAATPTDLGPLQQLPGTWRGDGTGWNMIALPFQTAPAPPAGFKFRVLMNQYSEELTFTFVDSDVPNRGLTRPQETDIGGNPVADSDQMVVTLDYQQKIAQTGAEDRPTSNGLAGAPGLPIHHEPGLWLYDKNRRAKDDHMRGADATLIELDVARLASIPHGNSVLALGWSEVHNGMPDIPAVSGLPSGRFEDVSTVDYDFRDAAAPDPYLEPYRHYIDHPFMGNVSLPTFPGFSPADMNEILRFANQGVDIVRTTTLNVDSTRRTGRVSSVPFSTREAEPVSMKIDVLDPGAGREGRVRQAEVASAVFAGGHAALLPTQGGRLSGEGRLAAHQHRHAGEGSGRGRRSAARLTRRRMRLTPRPTGRPTISEQGV